MQPVLKLIERVGPSDANALITGEHGTGKEVAARWIQDGTGERLSSKLRQEAIVRQRMVQERLSGFDYATAPYSLHGWLMLPEPWRASQFAADEAPTSCPTCRTFATESRFCTKGSSRSWGGSPAASLA